VNAPLLRVDKVAKAYRSGGRETPVLRDVSLELERGATASLVGVSGSGKSTLLSLLTGLMRPQSGSVVFDGTDLGRLDDRSRARLRARRIGVVLQSGNLIPFLTAEENVELAVELAGGARHPDRAAALLHAVGLLKRLDHKPARLSGGEAQRVAIARALLADRPILVLDEATAFADPESEAAIQDALSRLAAGRTLVVIAHRLSTVAGADQILVLSGGRIVERGRHDELLAADGEYARLWQAHERAS
jgi:ABC-type multidrug transport system fused ATPase/permease subunit